MQQQKLLTVTQYASAHRMTMHKVIQQVRKGELESVLKDIEGKEVMFVVDKTADSADEKKLESETDYKRAYETLLAEHRELKARYAALLKGMI